MVNKLILYGCKKVSYLDFYKDIFSLGKGLIQREGENETDSDGKRIYKANPILFYSENFVNWRFRVLFDDTFEACLAEALSGRGRIVLTNGVTYFGRRNKSDMASKLFCFIFDLDGIDEGLVENFFSGIKGGVYPPPSYIVLSGNGMHLYYSFAEPLALFPHVRCQLKELKYALTRLMWNRNTSRLEKPQMQGIFQSFRVVGSEAKKGALIPIVTAFKFREAKWTVGELNNYVPAESRVDVSKLTCASRMTLAEAKKRYPKWYERVVMQKTLPPSEPAIRKWDIAGKVHGDDPWALYHWWLRKIKDGASFGHRYFAIMALCIYAVKNNVPFEVLNSDAEALIPFMNSLNPQQPFTENDIKSALECYSDCFCTFPNSDIERLTAISIPHRKRNGRKLALHLQIMRAVKQVLIASGNSAVKGGRPSKKDIVEAWQMKNPQGKKVACIKDTGLSKATVYRWWK